MNKLTVLTVLTVITVLLLVPAQSLADGEPVRISEPYEYGAWFAVDVNLTEDSDVAAISFTTVFSNQDALLLENAADISMVLFPCQFVYNEEGACNADYRCSWNDGTSGCENSWAFNNGLLVKPTTGNSLIGTAAFTSELHHIGTYFTLLYKYSNQENPGSTTFKLQDIQLSDSMGQLTEVADSNVVTFGEAALCSEDPDGVNPNIFTAVTTTVEGEGEDAGTYTDECANNNGAVLEYYCDGDTYTSETNNCDAGMRCNSGACYYPSCGDVDDSGVVDADDLPDLAEFIVGIKGQGSTGYAESDANKDGLRNALDYTATKLYIAGHNFEELDCYDVEGGI